MKLHSEPMKDSSLFEDNGKIVNGYALVDEYGYCYIIVYGEAKRDSLLEKFK